MQLKVGGITINVNPQNGPVLVDGHQFYATGRKVSAASVTLPKDIALGPLVEVLQHCGVLFNKKVARDLEEGSTSNGHRRLEDKLLHAREHGSWAVLLRALTGSDVREVTVPKKAF